MSHFDAPANSEARHFNQLVRESKLNNNPELSPREHHIGLLATELRTTKDHIRRSDIANDMFLIATHATIAAEERREQLKFAVDLANQGVVDPANRTPMQQLTHDLIAAARERYKLNVPTPPSLDAISSKSVPTGRIGAMDEDKLRRSLVESRAMCDEAIQNETAP